MAEQADISAERVSTPDPTDYRGAVWVKAALQVNPFEYKGSAAPANNFSSEQEYNRLLVEECLTQGVGLIAVTDHWCVDSAAGLIAAAGEAGVIPLPGFEASTSEGIHLLVIFEHDTPRSAINAAIGDCGVTPGCKNGELGKSFNEMLTLMNKRDALVIPAHANAVKGLLTNQSGVVLEQRIKRADLHAIGISPRLPEATDQNAVLEGRVPYARPHRLATVFADDICHPAGLRERGAVTWFKSSCFSLSALKLALRTPETRVRLDDPVSDSRGLIRSIKWDGGFLDGAHITFSSDLTTLIGGRGAGKSSVIETLRYALDLRPHGKQARVDHESLVDNSLGAGAKVSVTVSAVSPTVSEYRIERTAYQPPVVFDESGTATNLKPLDVVDSIEIFGQHELAELAQDKSAIAGMIERFRGFDDEQSVRSAIVEQLRTNRRELKKTEADQDALEDALADLPRLEAQEAQFRSNKVADRLKDERSLLEDEALLSAARERVRALSSSMEPLLGRSAAGTLARPMADLEKSPRAATLTRLLTTLSTLEAAVAQASSILSGGIESSLQEIESIEDAWRSETEGVRQQARLVMRTMQEQGIDVHRFTVTIAQLMSLKGREHERGVLTSRHDALLSRRRDLIEELRAHDESRRASLRTAIRSANDALGGVAFVKPVPARDRENIKAVVARHIRGQRSLIAGAIDVPEFSVAAFVETVRAGSVEEIADRYDVRGAQARSLVEAGEDMLRELEEYSIPLAAEVNLDIGSAGRREYRELDRLSKGQRATALLLLLLCASTSPLVIDQPEDDLDNRFVFDGVVKNLRMLKGRRQVIASTHNANVPVLGDAELIVTLRASSHASEVDTDGTGSMDVETVRQAARNILEGGQKAFEARQHIYGY